MTITVVMASLMFELGLTKVNAYYSKIEQFQLLHVVKGEHRINWYSTVSGSEFVFPVL